MRKLSILLLLAIAHFHVQAQSNTLHENFDVACITTAGMASGWLVFTPVPGTDPQGAWTCSPNVGRDLSNCVICSGTYSGHYHLDTSYLLTPLLDLAVYNGGRIFLNFDSKVTSLAPSGDTIAVLLTTDTGTIADTTPFTNMTGAAVPAIGSGDVSGWVTHQLDMSPYINIGAFRIAFRYISVASAGNEWFLDNVNLSRTPLQITDADKQTIPVTVVGASTSNKISLSYSCAEAGPGHLALYDMMGREVYKENIALAAGQNTHTINDLGLVPGMYVIKLGNAAAYSVAKVMIQ